MKKVITPPVFTAIATCLNTAEIRAANTENGANTTAMAAGFGSL